jgi:hypothetical protein
MAPATGAVDGCGSACTMLAASGPTQRQADIVEDKLKGYDITSTGLQPGYPKDYACSVVGR